MTLFVGFPIVKTNLEGEKCCKNIRFPEEDFCNQIILVLLLAVSETQMCDFG